MMKRKIIIENDEIIQPQPETKKVENIIEDDFVKQSSEEKMLKKGTKKKKESNEKKGTRKRCPNGEKKNKDGICVKK